MTLVNTFGIDDEKWQSVLSRNDSIVRSTVYFDNIEEITENGATYTQYFLDKDVIVIKRNGSFEYYQAFTDQQGSILNVYNRNGQAVFEARYDAWGKQTVTKNTIGLHHGYTGHEMLTEFGLIDMKGRVYDPAVGRFLSPDNYVQEPTNSQSFNRYSYCVNNPLKYVDPSGELFGIDDIVFAFAAIQMAGSMIKAAVKGENVWKAAGISLLSSAATYGIGSIFGCGGGIGRELLRAGTHGLSSGAATALSGGNFFNGFASGALSSGIGSFAQGVDLPNGIMIGYTSAMGGVASMATGGDFWQGAIGGLSVGFLNHSLHGMPYKKIGVGYYVAMEPLDEVVCRPSFSLSNSAKIGLAGAAIGNIGNSWSNIKTSTKSHYTHRLKKWYNSKDWINKHSFNITAKNSTIYNGIENGLRGTSKFLGEASFATNILENGYNAYNNGYIGLGNLLDISMSAASFVPGYGTAISIGYIGADWVYYQYSGENIRDALNNFGYIGYKWK